MRTTTRTNHDSSVIAAYLVAGGTIHRMDSSNARPRALRIARTRARRTRRGPVA